MNKIAIYSGPGSEMLENLTKFLEENSINYSLVDEKQIAANNFDFKTLIIGGGQISSIMPAIGDLGSENIIKFVENGGKYIGICAGAYVACQTFFDHPGKASKGIGLSTTVFDRGKGENVVEMMDGKKLFFCNGPLLKTLGTSEKIISQNADGTIVIIKKNLGQGKVYLFSAHPEGNIECKISAESLGSTDFFIDILNK